MSCKTKGTVFFARDANQNKNFIEKKWQDLKSSAGAFAYALFLAPRLDSLCDG